MLIKDNDTILFQGDSITEWGRRFCINNACNFIEDDLNNTKNVGYGYVRSIAQQFFSVYPKTNVSFINKGIRGNRTDELIKRWQSDCIDLKPNILTLLIGYNDCWNACHHNIKNPEIRFRNNYIELMDITKKELPNTKIILMDPYLLVKEDIDETHRKRKIINTFINVVREIAYEYKTEYIPLDSIFAKACIEKNSYSEISKDGVHPYMYGSNIIADAWLKAVGVKAF